MSELPSARSSDAAARQVRWALFALFCLALGMRLGYAYAITVDPEDALYNFHSVQGVPFSDAQSWDLAAAEFSRVNPVPPYWTGRRPFYYWFLGSIYAWTGPSFTVALAANLLLSALTVPLLADVGRRTFGWPVGIGLAVWAIFDSESIVSSIQILTEPLGALLVVWHMALLLKGVERGGWTLAWAGVVFALSNLTRVLILLALPGAACCVAWAWARQGLTWRRGLWAGGAFAVGAAVCLAPYMLKQYLSKGIVSFQDSSAQHFYASTSPEYGQYDHEIERLADDQGLVDVRERYAFYMREARKNLLRHPGFFVRNQLKLIWHWTLRSLPTRSVIWLSVAAALCLALSGAARWQTAGKAGAAPARRLAGAALSVTLATLTAAGCFYFPSALWLVACAAAVAAGLISRRLTGAVLLANLVWFTLAALALAGWDDDRVLILFQWAWVALGLGGLSLVHDAAWSWLALPGAAAPAAPLPEPFTINAPGRVAKWALAAALLTLFKMLVNGALAPDRPMLKLSAEQTRAAAQLVCQHNRAWLQPEECAMQEPQFGQLLARHEAPADNGKLLIMTGRVTRYVHYFPRGARTHAHWRQFQHRPYERTVFLFEGWDAIGGAWYNFCVFPGALPPHSPNDTWVMAARVSATTDVYQQFVIEALGLAPYDAQRGEFDAAKIVWADDPKHVEVVRRLVVEAQDSETD